MMDLSSEKSKVPVGKQDASVNAELSVQPNLVSTPSDVLSKGQKKRAKQALAKSKMSGSDENDDDKGSDDSRSYLQIQEGLQEQLDDLTVDFQNAIASRDEEIASIKTSIESLTSIVLAIARGLRSKPSNADSAQGDATRSVGFEDQEFPVPVLSAKS